MPRSFATPPPSARRRPPRSGRRLTFVLGALAFGGICGCGAILGVDFGGAILVEDDGAAAADGRTPADATASDGAMAVDAAADADGAPRFDAAPPRCPDGRGPRMIEVTGQDPDGGAKVDFCIDSTETTNAQYRQFASTIGEADLVTIGSKLQFVCAARFTAPLDVASTLQTQNLGGGTEIPATGMGWCQAQAYCAWAGKRLCGGLVDGKPFSILATPDLEREWVFACTKGGTRDYSYGQTAVLGTCNVGLDAGAEPAATRTGCVGGYDRLYDMLGNVREWSNGWKDDGAGAGDPVYVSAPGSFFVETSYMTRCVDQGGDPFRDTEVKNGGAQIGIRCCATP